MCASFFQSDYEKAQAAKNKGNKYFKAGRYDQAINCYTEAIEICPAENANEIATFYQNRAAAYEQLVRFLVVKHEKVAKMLVLLYRNC